MDNPSKRPINTREPEASKEPPKPPDSLSVGARAEWDHITKILGDMGLLSETDGNALVRFCETHAEIQHLQNVIAIHGRTYSVKLQNGEGTAYRKRPEVEMLKEAEMLYFRYLNAFGLTPVARTRVQVPNGAAKNKKADSESYFA